LVVTQKKTCGFGATLGFGGGILLFFGFGGDFFDALMVVTKKSSTCGGDKHKQSHIWW